MTPADRSTLQTLARDCRNALRWRAGGGAILAGLAVFATVLPLAWLLAGGQGWTPGSPIPILLVLTGGIGALWIARRSWRRIDRWAGEEVLAEQMERGGCLPDGAVRAQLELGRRIEPGQSSALARAGERAIMDRLPGRVEGLVPEGHRDSGRLLRRGALFTAGLALLILGLWVMTPERSRTAWTGLTSPLGVLLPDALPPLVLAPGDFRAPRGDAVDVSIEAPGRAEVVLHWESPGAVPSARTLPVTEGAAGGRLPPLESEMHYWVTAPDGARTPTFRLEPEDPLLLGDLSIEVRFPPHTGLPSERHTATPGSLEIPAGSVLAFTGRVLGEATGITLRGEGGELATRIPVDTGALRGEWRPRGSGHFVWGAEGATAVDARLPDPLRIVLVPDAPPFVRLETAGGVRELPSTLRLPLELVATDDWGLDWVELEVVPEEATGRPGEPVTDRTPADDRREVALHPILDLSGWGLAPGSSVRLRARAADRAPTPGVTETPEIVLRLPDTEAFREGARDRVEEAARAMGELSERAARLDDPGAERGRAPEAGAPGDRAMDPQQEGFQAREELRAGLEEQEALARDVEALREELERARETLGGEGADAKLRERMQELERLLAEIGGEEARDRFRSLIERLEQGEEIPRGDGDLEALDRWQEELRERLEEAVERFRRAALESAFEGAEEEAAAVADAQEALSESLREDPEGSAAEQERTEARAAALEERLQALEERLRDAGDPDAAEAAASARESLEAARDAMDQASEAGRGGDGEEAGERADEASEDARAAQEALEEARMEWLEAWEEEVRDALLRGAQDALSLARIQGELREELRMAGSGQRNELLAREAVLLEGVRNLGTSLGLATRQAGRVGREISIAVGQALTAVERSVEGLRGGGTPRGGPFAAAGQAQDALNQVALLALLGRDQVGERPPPGESGEFSDEMDGLAGDQEAVNDATASLSPDAGEPGAAQQMQELAAAQAAMAGALGDLADRFGGQDGSDPLREMAEEAREIAQALEEGRLDAEVIQRQEALLERLLEAGRTLERDGPTEEREGTTARSVDRPPVRALPPGLLQGSEIPLPSGEILQGLSPAERRLVLEYFDRLNRRGAPVSSPPSGGTTP